MTSFFRVKIQMSIIESVSTEARLVKDYLLKCVKGLVCFPRFLVETLWEIKIPLIIILCLFVALYFPIFALTLRGVLYPSFNPSENNVSISWISWLFSLAFGILSLIQRESKSTPKTIKVTCIAIAFNLLFVSVYYTFIA